jgi:hypothetical protein
LDGKEDNDVLYEMVDEDDKEDNDALYEMADAKDKFKEPDECHQFHAHGFRIDWIFL